MNKRVGQGDQATPTTHWLDSWSWGACLFPPVWAIRFKVWIGLASLLPVIGWVIVPVYMGIRGRRLAWQAAGHATAGALDQIRRADKQMTHWGIVLLIITSLAEGFLLVFHDIKAHSQTTPRDIQLAQSVVQHAQQYAYFGEYLALKQASRSMIEHLAQAGAQGNAGCGSAAQLADRRWQEITGRGDTAMNAITRGENVLDALAAQEVALRDVIRFGEAQDCY